MITNSIQPYVLPSSFISSNTLPRRTQPRKAYHASYTGTDRLLKDIHPDVISALSKKLKEDALGRLPIKNSNSRAIRPN